MTLSKITLLEVLVIAILSATMTSVDYATGLNVVAKAFPVAWWVHNILLIMVGAILCLISIGVAYFLVPKSKFKGL